MPPIAPKETNTNHVPSRSSSQCPNTAGNTISSEIVVIRELKAKALAIGDRSSVELVTGKAHQVQVSGILTGQPTHGETRGPARRAHRYDGPNTVAEPTTPPYSLTKNRQSMHPGTARQPPRLFRKISATLIPELDRSLVRNRSLAPTSASILVNRVILNV